jgi:hypothetical protein
MKIHCSIRELDARIDDAWERERQEMKTQQQSCNRYRSVRLVLSCTPEEAQLVRRLAEGRTVQSYLMNLVITAAARQQEVEK